MERMDWLARTYLAIILTAALAAACAGDEATPAAMRRDRHGDPLPAGAVTRLGTTRWRANGEVYQVCPAPDGKRLILAGNHMLSLWDTSTGRMIRTFPDEGVRYAWTVAYAHDGKTIYAAGQSEVIRAWDVETGKVVRKFEIDRGVIRVMALTPDGKRLAIRGSDNTLRLWDTATGKQIWLRKTPEIRYWMPFALAADGTRLACPGDFNLPPQLWDTTTGAELWRDAKPKHIEAMAYSPDGAAVAMASYETVSFLDVATKKWSAQTVKAPSTICSLAFAPDGTALAAADYHGNVLVWDWPALTERHRHISGSRWLRSVAFTSDSRVVFAAGTTGAIHVWDAQTGQAIEPAPGHASSIEALAFLPDGRGVVTSGNDGTVRVWEPTTGRQLHRFAVHAKAATAKLRAGDAAIHVLPTTIYGPQKLGQVAEINVSKHWWRSAQAQYPNAVVFTPDGALSAELGDKHRILVSERATGKVTHALDGHSKQIRALAFSPDGKWLASGGDDETFFVWDTITGKRLSRVQNQGELLKIAGFPPGARSSAGIEALAFAPDGGLLAVGIANDVYLWDPARQAKLTTKAHHASSVTALAFSPDGRLLASAARMEGRSCYVWETATLQQVRAFRGHEHQVSCVAFAPSGRLVASASPDSTALVWDVTGRAPDGVLPPHALSPKDAAALWQRLGDADAAQAWDAVWSLVAAPDAAVTLLAKHLEPAPQVEPAMAAQWIADLSSDRFTARDRAMRELDKAGDAVAPALRQALTSSAPLELRRRVEALLAKHWPALEELRRDRALAALEQIGSPAALRHLDILAAGSPDARLTRQALGAAKRLRAGS